MPEHTTTETDRSTEATIESHAAPVENRLVRWGSSLLVLSGIGFVVNGLVMLYRVFFSAGFEAGVDTLGGVTRAELAATNHELLHYVDHLHVNVAALLIAVGISVAALAWFGVRRGRRWALATASALPLVFLAHSLPIHQTANFSFDAVQHLGPGIAWLPAFVIGAVLSYGGLRSADGVAAERAESGDP